MVSIPCILSRWIVPGTVPANEGHVGQHRLLPAKDRSIASAKFEGRGREIEYRICGIPGLVLVAQRPRRDGRTSRIWRVYYASANGGHRTIRKIRLGPYPTVGLAEARRKAAEVMEAVERGADPAREQTRRKQS